MNKQILLITLLIALFTVSLVSASVTVVTPTTAENLTGTFVVNCSYVNVTDIHTPLPGNISFRFNASGTDEVFTTRTGLTITANAVWATLTASEVSDGAGALICELGNATTGIGHANGTVRLTVDTTSPSVSFTSDLSRVANGRSITYSTSSSDATSGLSSTTCTATDPSGTAHTLSSSATNLAYSFDRTITEGAWTFACTAVDYAGNTKTSSKTITTSSVGRAYALGDTNVGNVTKVGSNNNNTLIIVIIIAAIAAFLLMKKK